MNATGEKLYEFLPAIYRSRDGENTPLKTLLDSIGKQLALVEGDLDRLYDNWFIETCEEWLVPYLGDLLGVHPFHQGDSRQYSLRAYVANTIAYRRRKGTLAVLEQLARDITGWPAKGVEFFQLLTGTQHVRHPRPGKGGSLKVCGKGARDGLELLGGPFERAAHTADVSRTAAGRRRYAIPKVGLFLWRQQAYRVTDAQPGKLSQPGCYTFDPFGRDLPLFIPPLPEEGISHLAEEINVPGRARRLPLYLEAEWRRKIKKFPAPHFDLQVFTIKPEDAREVLPPEAITVCDLKGWTAPVTGALFAVDPVLGRVKDLRPAGAAGSFRVGYCYGFSADLGGGAYFRDLPLKEWYGPEPEPKYPFWHKTVTLSGACCVAGEVPALGQAIKEWEEWRHQKERSFGLITITDNSSFEETATVEIHVPKGSSLYIVACRALPRRGSDVPQLSSDDLRPHIKGNLSLGGDGRIELNGLWIEGKVAIREGDLASLSFSHCTVFHEGAPGAVIVEGNGDLALSIDHSVLGPVVVEGDIAGLTIADSIVGGGGDAILTHHCLVPTTVERSTCFGDVSVTDLCSSESIFTGAVLVERRQKGCIRFSYLAPDPKTAVPRRFRCQPSLAITETMERLRAEGKIPDQAGLEEEICRRVCPSFVSTRHGDPGYAQLTPATPPQIRCGAEDGSEMGVFCSLKQPQREANLRAALDEYLRAGLLTEIFFIDEAGS
jgi:hypothetical protein